MLEWVLANWSGVLSPTGLAAQVMARTISMQFEGYWTPVSDIVVDKVGKYAYIIGSPHDTAITPVVMDVTLDVRTKVSTPMLCDTEQFSGDCSAHSKALSCV